MTAASLPRFSHRDPLPPDFRDAIVALGNFDGFHLGHQRVAGDAIDWARAEGRPAIIATFDPHPVRHFAPDAPPFRLTSLDQRAELFAAAGADAMLVFAFGAELADTSAQEFVEGLLARRIGAAGVVTGEDFTFGRRRGGNVTVLRRIGAACGIETRAIGPVLAGPEAGMGEAKVGEAQASEAGASEARTSEAGGTPVSSSRIREALKAGDPVAAARLLTRPFAIRGIVRHGDKRGRTIGYPTANLELGTYLRPRFGIYAVTARLLDTGELLQGAANLGIRPQFEPPVELLEPYFFNFAGDLYGREIEVALHQFLRPEARFDDLEALKAQMARDCEAAREALGART